MLTISVVSSVMQFTCKLRSSDVTIDSQMPQFVWTVARREPGRTPGTIM